MKEEKMLKKGISMNNEVKPIGKYKKSYEEKFGRYLIAAKKINAGEVILRESPVIVGAATFNDNCLCFSCMRVIHTSTSNFPINSTIQCTGCHIAVFCSVACETKNLYHTIEECKILKNKTISSKLNEFLLPLRLWMIKKQDKKLWEQILELEAHLDKRKNTHVWKNREEHVVNVIKSLVTIEKSEEINFSELLQQLCGILDVNSFELRSPGSSEDFSALRGLYLEAAFMAHDCRGNTHLTVDDDFQLTIYASKSIDEGEAILFRYMSPLMGMAERQEHLREGKYFECTCSLCEDPEELGTHLSTIFCPRCRVGLMSFENVQIKNPHIKGSIWKCKNCNNSVSGRMIKTCLDLTKIRIAQTNDSITDLEILIKQLSSTFHRNHYLMLDLKQKLLIQYRSDTACSKPSKKKLERVIELCKELLNVLEILEPGISCLKGLLLYEIHMPIVILANRAYASRKITVHGLMSQLEEAENYLKKSLTMLLLEPANSPEGILAKRALQEYKLLRQRRNDINSFTLSVQSTNENDK